MPISLYRGKSLADLHEHVRATTETDMKLRHEIFKAAEECKFRGDEERAFILYTRFVQLYNDAKVKHFEQYVDCAEIDKDFGKKRVEAAVQEAKRLASSLQLRYEHLHFTDVSTKQKERMMASERSSSHLKEYDQHTSPYARPKVLAISAQNTQKGVEDWFASFSIATALVNGQKIYLAGKLPSSQDFEFPVNIRNEAGADIKQLVEALSPGSTAQYPDDWCDRLTCQTVTFPINEHVIQALSPP